MRIYAALAAVVLLAGMPYASADTSDADFVKQAAAINANELQLSRIAQERAQNAELKNFAESEVLDHTRLGEKLARLALAKNVSLNAPILEQALFDRLASLQGMQFDRAFLDWTILSHARLVAQFSNEANSGQDQDVKTFAFLFLPALQEHLRIARDLNDRLGRGAAAAEPSKIETPVSTSYGTQIEEPAPVSTEFREQTPVQSAREHTESYSQSENSANYTVSYEQPVAASYSDSCCEEKCSTCNPCEFFTPVYDNDYSATLTSTIEHPE